MITVQQLHVFQFELIRKTMGILYYKEVKGSESISLIVFCDMQECNRNSMVLPPFQKSTWTPLIFNSEAVKQDCLIRSQ